GGEPQERRRCSTHEMIVFRDKVECLPSIVHGIGHIAPRLGKYGTIYSDRSREAAKFLGVHNDHLRRPGILSLFPGCRRFQPPFGLPQANMGSLELAAS